MLFVLFGFYEYTYIPCADYFNATVLSLSCTSNTHLHNLFLNRAKKLLSSSLADEHRFSGGLRARAIERLTSPPVRSYLLPPL